MFPLLADHNDVVQRNLHIQGTAPTGGSSGSSAAFARTLSWVQIDNPFPKPGVACLDIDATQARGLEKLVMEVNEEEIAEIKPGERMVVTVTDALEPADHRVIRFRATLPPKSREGVTFPIHLRFIVNDQLVSGYTHMLRVVPFSDVLLQVLDLLYGALRDVMIGCRLDQAQPLADRAHEILLRERYRKSTGCLGILWSVVRPKDIWRRELAALSGPLDLVAESLNRRTEPECRMAQRQMKKLVDVLRTSKDTPSPMLIEHIRDLADRIQEPAGRLARKQLLR